MKIAASNPISGKIADEQRGVGLPDRREQRRDRKIARNDGSFTTYQAKPLAGRDISASRPWSDLMQFDASQ